MIQTGGSGILALGEDIRHGQRVAIKYLDDSVSKHPDAVVRFLREVRLAMVLRSEHVGRVLDIGQAFSGVPYAVLEYVDGADLETVREKQGPLSVPVAVDYILQACVGIAEAHAHGIAHQDLRPQNLVLSQRLDATPLIKVTDFGIGKATLEMSEAELHTTAEILNSPLYLAPEQIVPDSFVGPGADIWALGTILYELLSGRRPFQSDNFSEQCAAIVKQTAVLAPIAGVPDGLLSVIQTCLQKEPDKRYRTVVDLARALVPFASPTSHGLSDRVRDSFRRRVSARAPERDLGDLWRLVVIMTLLTGAMMLLARYF